METKKINVRLPSSEVDFAEAYAKKHQLSVDEVIDRSLKLLQRTEQGDIHPDVLTISGIVPSEINAEAEYRDHLLRKHQ